MIDIEKIKAAAMAANKYEWRAEIHRETNYARIYMFPDSKDSLAGYCGKENATHIATANPSAVLELIERLEAAERDAADNLLIIEEAKEYLWMVDSLACNRLIDRCNKALDKAAMKESEK